MAHQIGSHMQLSLAVLFDLHPSPYFPKRAFPSEIGPPSYLVNLSVEEQPCSNQSIGMCVEDAAVFGGLFSRLRSWDQVPSLMEAYQDLRQERTHFVACQDQGNADITWCPPGPHRDARNAAMRADKQCGLDEFSEGMLRDQWDTVSEVFAYSASDAAADWWVGWGMLAEMAKRRTGDFLQIEMTVIPQMIAT